jgi:hypothetical protein
MPRYSVQRSEPLIDKLAQAWIDNPAIRNEIQAAVDALDRTLSYAPDSLGKSLPGASQTRYVVSPPVSILFVIQEMDRRVRIVDFNLWP